MFFSPFSKNKKRWSQKSWFYIMIKIAGVISFFFTLLCLFVAVYNMITNK
jgi:hypothetical protein